MLLFLPVLLAAMFVHYREYFSAGQSLFLSIFWDPTPRRGLYPWLVEATRQLRNGHFPLWCSLKGLGMPLAANFQTAPLNPFNIIFEIFPSLRLLDYLLMLKLILLGVFTYGFGRELRLSALAAATSAFSICFCGFLCENINHVNLSVDLWLPLGLVLVERILKDRANLARFLFLSLAAALALVGGNPQAAFFFFAFLLAYALIRGGWRSRREVLGIALGLGFGLALSCVQWLPFVEYLGFSWNYHTRALAALEFFHRADLFNARQVYHLFFPGLFGSDYNIRHLSELPGYVGLLPLFLAALALSKLKRLPPSARFLWIYALVIWGLIYRLPPFSVLDRLPILDLIRTPRHGYFSACFCIAMLSGYGLDLFLKKVVSRREGALALGLVLLAATLSLAVILPAAPAGIPIAHAAWVIPAGLLLAAGLLVMGVIFPQRKTLAGFLIATLVLANLLYLGADSKPLASEVSEYLEYGNRQAPPIYGPVVEDPDPGRMLATGMVLRPDFNVLCRVNDFREFDGIYPRSYAEAMADIYGVGMEDLAELYIRKGWLFTIGEAELDHKWLDRFGVKYIITERPVEMPDLWFLGRVEGSYYYQNSKVWPKVWVKTSSGRNDFESARISEYLPDRVTVAADSDGASELVLADQYAPGWRAFREPSGAELRILKEDLLLRRVALPKGRTEIRFRYQPWGFRIGLYFSLVSLFTALLALIAHQVRKRFARA